MRVMVQIFHEVKDQNALSFNKEKQGEWNNSSFTAWNICSLNTNEKTIFVLNDKLNKSNQSHLFHRCIPIGLPLDYGEIGYRWLIFRPI